MKTNLSPWSKSLEADQERHNFIEINLELILLLVRVLIYLSLVHVFRLDLLRIHLIIFSSLKYSKFYGAKVVEILTVAVLFIKVVYLYESHIFSQKATFDSVSQTTSCVTSLRFNSSDQFFHA
jgi:hypothetical protein